MCERGVVQSSAALGLQRELGESTNERERSLIGRNGWTFKYFSSCGADDGQLFGSDRYIKDEIIGSFRSVEPRIPACAAAEIKVGKDERTPAVEDLHSDSLQVVQTTDAKPIIFAVSIGGKNVGNDDFKSSMLTSISPVAEKLHGGPVK